ncbi:TetR/AcrR family transcriptional regulator [Rubrolithibacter danxiaensis]|uniref:TetR/AcrR family transcriptional regulator n=1 Tax=Rubrolithibacter danxiaensis TaxID=3390805 RepID=UPI003BF916F8
MRIRDEHKEQMIRQKAMEMVVSNGIDGLSMQKLARSAGVSPATIYIYFQDREDLLIQICIEETKKMSDATLQNFSPDMHFDEGLKIQWLNRAKYCLENPMHIDFIEQIRHSPLYIKAFELIDKTFMQTMGKFVSNAITRNELIRVPVEVYWSVAFAPLYQLLKFNRQGRSINGKTNFSLTEELMMQTLQLVLKALKP